LSDFDPLSDCEGAKDAVSTLAKYRTGCQSAAMDIENRPESDTMTVNPLVLSLDFISNLATGEG
jgi:hypothetical protein